MASVVEPVFSSGRSGGGGGVVVADEAIDDAAAAIGGGGGGRGAAAAAPAAPRCCSFSSSSCKACARACESASADGTSAPQRGHGASSLSPSSTIMFSSSASC